MDASSRVLPISLCYVMARNNITVLNSGYSRNDSNHELLWCHRRLQAAVTQVMEWVVHLSEGQWSTVGLSSLHVEVFLGKMLHSTLMSVALPLVSQSMGVSTFGYGTSLTHFSKSSKSLDPPPLPKSQSICLSTWCYFHAVSQSQSTSSLTECLNRRNFLSCFHCYLIHSSFSSRECLIGENLYHIFTAALLIPCSQISLSRFRAVAPPMT